jgi:AAA+ superfamily predicted ATPase
LFDPAIWRRFDDVVAFPLPSQSERLAQLRQLTNGLRLRGSLISVARQTARLSFGEIERAVNEVAKSQVLSGTETVLSGDITSEAKRWHAKMQAALGVGKRRR